MLTLAERSPILFTKTIYEIKEGGGGCAPVGRPSASYGHEFQNRLTSTVQRIESSTLNACSNLVRYSKTIPLIERI